jgi:hypothetical protein
MSSDATMLRLTAKRYRRLAEQTTDPRERGKFQSYANIYDELAGRHEQGALDQENDAQKVIAEGVDK